VKILRGFEELFCLRRKDPKEFVACKIEVLLWPWRSLDGVSVLFLLFFLEKKFP